ncbi:helix-turn-helix domain-containing protein [Streptomyces sp. NBC_01244]|uniref:helix-turn-helix domain-containing protein n=1 Tax=Streptomyces sp. NBC_01244 TaxID=2903797 RepID=UPI002E14D048|nr:hypothetical protein OG247_05275 [Streptomyces sp. NBC_01244]
MNKGQTDDLAESAGPWRAVDFRPDLDAADGCPSCESWGVLPRGPRSPARPCLDCQPVVRLMPKSSPASRLDQRWLRGAERTSFAQELRTLYEAGATVGELAWSHRRSHTLIYSLLTEAGVELPIHTRRRPGGPRGRVPEQGRETARGGPAR